LSCEECDTKNNKQLTQEEFLTIMQDYILRDYKAFMNYVNRLDKCMQSGRYGDAYSFINMIINILSDKLLPNMEIHMQGYCESDNYFFDTGESVGALRLSDYERESLAKKKPDKRGYVT